MGPCDARQALPLRDFGVTLPSLQRPVEPFEPFPTLVILSTASDTYTDWLRAGQALQHVLLLATIDHLTATSITQPLEIPALRTLRSAEHPDAPPAAVRDPRPPDRARAEARGDRVGGQQVAFGLRVERRRYPPGVRSRAAATAVATPDYQPLGRPSGWGRPPRGTRAGTGRLLATRVGPH